MTDERKRDDAELARDLLVAELVMGAVWNTALVNDPFTDADCTHELQFKPSSNVLAERFADGHILILGDNLAEYHTDFAAAWTVHQTMCDAHYTIRNEYMQNLQDYALATASFDPRFEGYVNRSPTGSGVQWVDWRNVLIVLRDDLPEAICSAALDTMTRRAAMPQSS